MDFLNVTTSYRNNVLLQKPTIGLNYKAPPFPLVQKMDLFPGVPDACRIEFVLQTSTRLPNANLQKVIKGLKPYYCNSSWALYLSDTFEALEKMMPETIDMIFADPPYFLSNGGFTCSGGKAVSVDKGDWDKIKTVEEKHEFNRRWIRMCRRVLKLNGTIWISGTLHNIFSVGLALEQEGFKILNNITWQKTNPPPNLACRCFTHSTETVIWAQKADKKAKHYFNYDKMKEINGGKQMKDVWTGALTPPSEKRFGKHPTQKPTYLLERILLASTRENDVVLDPFCGSSTTGVACKRLKRNYIGIDSDKKYIQLSVNRLKNE